MVEEVNQYKVCFESTIALNCYLDNLGNTGEREHIHYVFREKSPFSIDILRMTMRSERLSNGANSSTKLVHEKGKEFKKIK